jgi:hypothetical protein
MSTSFYDIIEQFQSEIALTAGLRLIRRQPAGAGKIYFRRGAPGRASQS